MRKNVQNIVAWSGEEGVPLLVTQSAFRCMVALAREQVATHHSFGIARALTSAFTQRWMLQYATHVKPFEHNLMRVMVRATKFSKAHKASSGGATGFFKLSASQGARLSLRIPLLTAAMVTQWRLPRRSSTEGRLAQPTCSRRCRIRFAMRMTNC